ncbi:squalene/phytoene synthase family protein [Candidatus Gracilibacteria bacterium]|nr:squalene/phytoene synthase family protein [Candidatus Gracilibacteria bacterium]
MEMNEILTGHEKYIDGKIDIDTSTQSIQDAMYSRDPEKYGDFLKTLGKVETALKAMLITKHKVRVELFHCVYYAMRLIDDVVDGDTVPPLSLEERRKLLDAIIQGSTNRIPNPLYKDLSLKIKSLSAQLGKESEMAEAIRQIIVSMKFDLDRIMDSEKTRSINDLQENFHKMDIIGTIAGTAIIFGIDPENATDLLAPLGEATRIIYNLEDFGDDVSKDLINIPIEDLKRFSISQEDIDDVKQAGKALKIEMLPKSIKEWFFHELDKIDRLMQQHTTKMQQRIKFSGLADIPLSAWRSGYVMKQRVLPETYEREVLTEAAKIKETLA